MCKAREGAERHTGKTERRKRLNKKGGRRRRSVNERMGERLLPTTGRVKKKAKVSKKKKRKQSRE